MKVGWSVGVCSVPPVQCRRFRAAVSVPAVSEPAVSVPAVSVPPFQCRRFSAQPKGGRFSATYIFIVIKHIRFINVSCIKYHSTPLDELSSNLQKFSAGGRIEKKKLQYSKIWKSEGSPLWVETWKNFEIFPWTNYSSIDASRLEKLESAISFS